MNKQEQAHFEHVLALSARVIMLREQLTRVQEELPEAESVLAGLLAGRDEMPSKQDVVAGRKAIVQTEFSQSKLPASATERQVVASPSHPDSSRAWGPGVAPVRKAVLAKLRQGPLTTAELCHRLIEKHGLPRQSGYDQIFQLSKKGLVVKREEPSTHLDKWFLVESPRNNGASA